MNKPIALPETPGVEIYDVDTAVSLLVGTGMSSKTARKKILAGLREAAHYTHGFANAWLSRERVPLLRPPKALFDHRIASLLDRLESEPIAESDEEQYREIAWQLLAWSSKKIGHKR